MSKSKEVIGATTEHWMDKRIRQHKPINLPGNVIRISAVMLIKMHNEKNRLLGEHKTLKEADEETRQDRENYQY